MADRRTGGGGMKTKIILAGLLLSLLWAPVAAFAMTPDEVVKKLEAIKWYSEEYPPYNFKNSDGTTAGMAVDILMTAFRKIGVGLKPADIKIVPWNRSYKFIQKKPNTALFSTTYTPERRQIMKFVGPSVPSNISVIAAKKKKLSGIKETALGSLRIGVVRDDIGDQLIRKYALSDEAIMRKNSLKQVLYLLDTGRIDAVAYAVDVFNWATKNAGGDPFSYQEILVLKKGQLGYAFHKSTDRDVLMPLQKAVDELRADGTIAKIINRYSK